MRIRLYLLLFSGLYSMIVTAQYENNSTYGLKFGALYSKISNLPEMIRGRNNTLDNSTIESKGAYGVEGGFFLNYKLPDTRVALQPEILYRQSEETVSYNDITNKKYELQFKYSYLVVGALYKAYPYKGLNAGIGAFYGVNLSPSALEYASNEADGMYDVATRQFYKDGLDGKDDFSLCFALGYELRQSLHIDLRYYYGISDVVSSNTSSFQFIENQNKSSVFSFSVGYSFHQW